MHKQIALPTIHIGHKFSSKIARTHIHNFYIHTCDMNYKTWKWMASFQEFIKHILVYVAYDYHSNYQTR